MLKFIDLFCGIGGFHQAIQRVFPKSECVMACDSDKHVRETYQENYGILPEGDIKELDPNRIPSFDIVCAGFPCQAFSAAGRKGGFSDPRGTLFFDILKIIDVHKPKLVLLENVANLVTIEKGNAFSAIRNELTARGYKVSHAVLTPHQFGIPQSRERVYIVASRVKEFDFSNLKARKSACSLRDILDNETSYLEPSKYTLLDESQIKTQAKSGLRFCGYINGSLRKKGARENTEHLSRVHKQTCRIHSADGTQATLAASETSGRYHIYDGKGVRKLTLKECYKLMDFPSTFKINKRTGSAYKQIGNSVCVKVIEEVVKELVKQGLL